MKYYETKSTDCYYNLAFEDYLLSNVTDGDILMLWQNDNTIVLGANQNAYAEINQEYVKEKNINVVRRSTGGGAVYHDLGNLNYSFITNADSGPGFSKEKFAGPVIEALKSFGIEDAKASGRNDILVCDKKVSGTAGRSLKGRMLYHGTLLFNSDMSVLSNALIPDPDKLAAKGIASVKSRVANIKDYISNDISIDEFWSGVLKSIAGLSRDDAEVLPGDALEEIKKLREEKYATWEWNFGKSPEYEFARKRRFDEGTIEAHVNLDHGLIKEIKIYGDFLAVYPLDKFYDSVIGKPFDEDELFRTFLRFLRA